MADIPTGNGAPPLTGGIAGQGFKWTISFLEKHGQARYGTKFRIDEIDHPTVFALLAYFLRQEHEAAELGLDLGKGILLSGPVGCGKTSLMTLMKLVALPLKAYTMRACREISFEFMREDFEVVGRYSNLSFNNSEPKIYCFDDLGSESTLRNFGNSCNVMAEIIQSRYELYISCGMITHLTTNLHADGIEQAYGDRVRSRMREMFNLVAFDENSRDKRV